MTPVQRPILVVAHTGRRDALEAAVAACAQLRAAGATPVIPADQGDDLRDFFPDHGGSLLLLGVDVQPQDLELVVVLGGDGTILRAAELVRGASAPLLGVNLGHVGFLAESERDNLSATSPAVSQRDYLVEERMTLSVRGQGRRGSHLRDVGAQRGHRREGQP